MTRRRHLSLLNTFVGSMLAGVAPPPTTALPRSVADNIQRLKLQDPDAVKRLKTEVQETPEYRPLIIVEVIRLVDDPQSSSDTRKLCINLLGQLRAIEGIDVLVRHLWETTSQQGLSEWHYPAVEALHRIGRPAVPALVKALKENPNREIRVYAARTLGAIGGTNSEIGLKEAAQTEKNLGVRQAIGAQLRALEERR